MDNSHKIKYLNFKEKLKKHPELSDHNNYKREKEDSRGRKIYLKYKKT